MKPFPWPWEAPFRYDDDGTCVVDKLDRMILDVRGWGFLTGMGGLRTGMSLGLDEEIAIQLQRRLGNMLADFLNSSVDPPRQLRINKIAKLICQAVEQGTDDLDMQMQERVMTVLEKELS